MVIVTLVIQGLTIISTSYIEAQSRLEQGFSTSGIEATIVLLYAVMTIIPFGVAKSIFHGNRAQFLLIIWMLASFLFGNHFINAWQISSNNNLILWSLMFLLPSWVLIVYVGKDILTSREIWKKTWW